MRSPTQVEILNQEIDPDDATPSYYRTFVNKTHFKYITIDPGIFDVDDLCFPPTLFESLPSFSLGDWNYGRISKVADSSAPYFAETMRKCFASINPLWHSESYDYLSLKIGNRLMSNVYMASSPGFKSPIFAKFARFDWETAYYIAETQAYPWIEGLSIGPKFLGYIAEDGRTIGFLIEYVEGRHASITDLPACKALVTRLHGLGILHGDLNRHNFLVSESGVVLIDFEMAKRENDTKTMGKELEELELKLSDKSRTGGVIFESG